MAIKTNEKTHLDHGLSQAHMKFVVDTVGDREGFFLLTEEMPAELDDLPCGLHGPTMGDEPIDESQVSYEVRNERPGPSRLTTRPFRPSRLITMVGWNETLFSAWGGPAAEREPWDSSLSPEEKKDSLSFWAGHALSA